MSIHRPSTFHTLRIPGRDSSRRVQCVYSDATLCRASISRGCEAHHATARREEPAFSLGRQRNRNGVARVEALPREVIDGRLVAQPPACARRKQSGRVRSRNAPFRTRLGSLGACWLAIRSSRACGCVRTERTSSATFTCAPRAMMSGPGTYIYRLE